MSDERSEEGIEPTDLLDFLRWLEDMIYEKEAFRRMYASDISKKTHERTWANPQELEVIARYEKATYENVQRKLLKHFNLSNALTESRQINCENTEKR